MAELFANSGDPYSAASDLGLNYLPVTRLGVSRLKWVNRIYCYERGFGRHSFLFRENSALYFTLCLH